MRESTKHGPRLDDALKAETRSLEQGAPIEARVEADREKEGPADAERDVDVTTAPPDALGADAVEARRELSRHLRRSAFPGTRDDLLAEAESQHATAAVLAALAGLPGDERFATVHEVWAALEGRVSRRDAERSDAVTRGDR
jgi:Protein of unknown function (DUF2795)